MILMIYVCGFLLVVIASYPLQPADASPLSVRGGASGTSYSVHKRRQKLQRVREDSIKFAVTNAALYVVLHRAMVKIGVWNVVSGSCYAVTGLWWLSSLLDDFGDSGEDKNEDEDEDENDYLHFSRHFEIVNNPEKHDIATSEYITLQVKPGSNVTWPDGRFLLVDAGEIDLKIYTEFCDLYSDASQTPTQRQARARRLLGRVPNNRTIKFFTKDAYVHLRELLNAGVTDADKDEEEVSKSQFQTFLEEHFMAPASWAALRSRPFSVFGSTFSHITPSHITANLASLQLYANYGEQSFGRSGFAHLYLCSALGSILFGCIWDKLRLNEACRGEGLGASGAISGVMAGCLLSMQRYGGKMQTLRNGKQTLIEPLALLLVHVLGDVSGLTQSVSLSVLTEILKLKVLGDEDEDKDDVKKKEEEEEEKEEEEEDNDNTRIGFDAHVGGFLGGTFFFLLS